MGYLMTVRCGVVCHCVALTHQAVVYVQPSTILCSWKIDGDEFPFLTTRPRIIFMMFLIRAVLLLIAV